MKNHDEPTFENQLWHAQKLMREQGREALDNPHGMIGKTCGCGDCFCCAAAQVLRAPGGVYPSRHRLQFRATGEFRPPKKNELYLWGAVIEAYKAPNDLSTAYWIAEPV